MTRQRTLIGAAIAAVVLVAGVVVFTVASGSDSWPAPQTKPDPVPAEKVVAQYPVNCGLGAATLGRLVANPSVNKGGDLGECDWTQARGAKTRRSLKITIQLNQVTSPSGVGPTGDLTGTPVSTAMGKFGPSYSNGTLKPIAGLGDEAIAQYADSLGVNTTFRFQNALVIVNYRDIYSKGLTQEAALGATLKAAAEVVTALGAPGPVRPTLDTSAREPLIQRPPDICALSSAARKLVKGGQEGKAATPGFTIEGAKADSCEWQNDDRSLTVKAVAAPDSAKSGGVQVATREYLRQHHAARGEEPISSRDKKYFQALAGLGEQAFGAYVPEGSPGRVVFRVRNVLVEVTLRSAKDAKPLSQDVGVNGAYAVAKEVAKALSSTP